MSKEIELIREIRAYNRELGNVTKDQAIKLMDIIREKTAELMKVRKIAIN